MRVCLTPSPCRYAPSRRWHIDQLLSVLLQAGQYVQEDVCRALVVLITNTPDLNGYAVRAMFKWVGWLDQGGKNCNYLCPACQLLAGAACNVQGNGCWHAARTWRALYRDSLHVVGQCSLWRQSDQTCLCIHNCVHIFSKHQSDPTSCVLLMSSQSPSSTEGHRLPRSHQHLRMVHR